MDENLKKTSCQGRGAAQEKGYRFSASKWDISDPQVQGIFSKNVVKIG